MLFHPSSRRALLRGGAALGIVGCRPALHTDGPKGGSTGTDTGSPPTHLPARPNILFVYADQHRADVVSGTGNGVAYTPNIDSLIAAGVAFTNTFTNGPSCRPARFAMMSQRYPTQTGVWDNFQFTAPDSVSHVRRIRDEADYFSMVIGKTHLYDSEVHTDTTISVLQDWGFTDAIEMLGPTEQTIRESRYSDFLTATTPAGEQDKYSRWTNYVDTTGFLSPPPDSEPWLLATSDHQDVFTGTVAADWIRNYNDPRPFYLQLNFPGPHKPFDSTSEFRALFDPTLVNLPPAILQTPVDPSPLVSAMLAQKEQDWDAESAAFLAHTYYGKVSLVDTALGYVLDALEETGQLANTWIIYHSDHAEMLADHTLTGKVVFYESAIRVPLVIQPPGGVAPWICTGLTDTLDVIRTIVEIAGLVHNDPLAPGQSLLAKVLAGPGAADAQVHKSEILSSNISSTMIRTATHKLVFDRALNPPTVTDLFDLVADPSELNNVRIDPAYLDIADDLLGRLLAVDEIYPPGTGEFGKAPS